MLSTGSTSFLQYILPPSFHCRGYFSEYLIGIIPIVVLGIGSTSPGLLAYFIDKFSLIFPDYKDRVIRHGRWPLVF